jgi:hypothetical protein
MDTQSSRHGAMGADVLGDGARIDTMDGWDAV